MSTLSEAPAPAPAPAPDWRTSIPAEFAQEPMLKNIQDIPTLVKSYVHAQRLVGVDKMPAPQKTWNETQWAEHFDRLGRPKTFDEYALSPDIKPVDGVTIDDKKLAGVKERIHKLGLSKKDGDAILSQYVEMMNKDVEDAKTHMTSSREQGVQALKTEFGDKFDTTVELAKGVVREFGGEDFMKYLDESGLGNDPRAIKAFAKIGQAMMEDADKGSGRSLNLTSASNASLALDRMKLDKDVMSALLDRRNPGHASARQQWEALHAAAAGNSAPVE